MYVMEDNTAAAYSCRAAEAEPSGSPAAMAMDGEAAANLHILAKQAESAYQYVEKPVYEAVKRIFDLVFASIALVVLSPLMLIVAIAIKLEDGGSVIFKQPRIGKRKKTFLMYKFRSMYQDAEKMLANMSENQRIEFSKNFKLENDPRITKVGSWIRTSSMDELPQLLNILLGHMSFVGPRPPLLDEERAYGPHLDKAMSVRPGLTGYWQVHGRSDTDFSERIEMVEYYIDNRCLKMDLKILLDTFGVVVSGKGAK